MLFCDSLRFTPLRKVCLRLVQVSSQVFVLLGPKGHLVADRTRIHAARATLLLRPDVSVILFVCCVGTRAPCFGGVVVSSYASLPRGGFRIVGLSIPVVSPCPSLLGAQ